MAAVTGRCAPQPRRSSLTAMDLDAGYESLPSGGSDGEDARDDVPFSENQMQRRTVDRRLAWLESSQIFCLRSDPLHSRSESRKILFEWKPLKGIPNDTVIKYTHLGSTCHASKVDNATGVAWTNSVQRFCCNDPTE